MESELAEVLEILGLVEHYIQSVGAIAAPKTAIEVVPHSQSGKRYARKRIPVEGKNTFEGCGLEGSTKHLAAIATVQRRRLLDKAQDLMQQIEAWQQSEDWQALKQPARNTIKAPDNRERNEAPPPTFPTPTAESDLISFGFKGGKGATLDNRIVHAIPGEPAPPFMLWFAPALCGAKPNFLKHWGWIGDCTIMYLSCRKCEKKLKQMEHTIKLPGGIRSRNLVIDSDF
jgi:hypothetical protein